MKFARDFQESLEQGEYPQDWIDSAISYRKLKKCIRKVQQELRGLGLDQETLELLWQHVAGNAPVDSPKGKFVARTLRYSFQDGDEKTFTPTLTIALDPRDGSPMDAWLSPETKRHLRELASVQSLEPEQLDIHRLGSVPLPSTRHRASVAPQTDEEGNGYQLEIVEVPLTADSEFFHLLRHEISNLEKLQKRQQTQLQSEIAQLGKELASMKSSTSKKSKSNIETWREIFRLYTESQIFFSSHEQDAGARDVQHAQKQLQQFSKAIVAHQVKVRKLDANANNALERFLRINLNLLQFLRFQDINRTALTKIMKKFDKRTALRAQDSISQSIGRAPFMAQDLAKAASFTISEELLTLIPQLDDYLCPVCFSISFKPIRLRCNHLFCIRCMITMQQRNQKNCPICREEVVMEACGFNVDEELKQYLKKNFPVEVKAKQKENEHAALIDQGQDIEVPEFSASTRERATSDLKGR